MVNIGYKWQTAATGERVRVINYRYRLSGIGFRFNLLSEVGEPKMAAMKRALARFLAKHCGHVEKREFNGSPHYADVLVAN